MAVRLDEIRKAAQRVAASHGLDVVDMEFAGPARDRILRVTLEKNAEGRAQLKAAAEAGVEGLPEKLLEGSLAVERFQGCLVKVQTFEPVRNNRHWQGRLVAGAETPPETRKITLDLAAVKQNSKSRKTGLNTVEIALSNIEKANLVPEI